MFHATPSGMRLTSRRFFLSVLLAGCSSGDSPQRAASSAPEGPGVIHPYNPRGLTCLDYPEVGYRVFPRELDAPAKDWPECTPSCDPRLVAVGGFPFPLDQDLPAGPCEDEGATCRSAVTAGWCGPCRDMGGGPGNGYRCTCREKRWQCAIVSQGAAACGPPACLGGECRSWTRTDTEVCGCGVCRKLCASATDCPSGRCRVGELCFPPESCPGPGECSATCTGFCE
jgi:hypothetical protein